MDYTDNSNSDGNLSEITFIVIKEEALLEQCNVVSCFLRRFGVSIDFCMYSEFVFSI